MIQSYTYPKSEGICHINNVKISFHQPKSAVKVEDKPKEYPSIKEQPISHDINLYQLRPSSNIIKYDKVYRQYYQCCHEFDAKVSSSTSKEADFHPLFQISEYQIEWPQDLNDMTLYSIKMAGLKFVLPRIDAKATRFQRIFPMQDPETHDIRGTQLRCKTKSTVQIPRAEIFRTQNECVLANYFYYYEDKKKHEEGNIRYTIVEAQLTQLMIEGLQRDEKFMLLQNAIRTILSAIPADEKLLDIENKDTIKQLY